MTLNSKLRAIYQAHWEDLIKNGSRISAPVPTNPILLCFDEVSFSASGLKIMICGQETWGWDGFGTSIEEGMNTYQRFFIERNFYPGYGKSAFWKAFRFFETQLGDIFKNQTIQYIYQNLSKIGRNDGATGVTKEIRSLERQYFPVLRDEVCLLNPDIVLFLTGPNRDHDILFHFPDADFLQTGSEPNIRRVARVRSSDLPCRSLRLYHPSYFRAWTNTYKAEAVSLVTEKENKPEQATPNSEPVL